MIILGGMNRKLLILLGRSRKGMSTDLLVELIVARELFYFELIL